MNTTVVNLGICDLFNTMFHVLHNIMSATVVGCTRKASDSTRVMKDAKRQCLPGPAPLYSGKAGEKVRD